MGSKINARGQGSFKQNENGTVTHRKMVGYTLDGRRKILTVTADTEAACIKKMRQKENEWEEEKQRLTPSSVNTVTELCMKHLQYQVEMEELKPKSIDRRECTIKNHIEDYPIGHMQVQSVQISDVEAHISSLIMENHLSPSSIEKVVDVLNAAYNWAIVRGTLDFNPVAPVKSTLMKRIQKLQKRTATDPDVMVLSEEEAAAFETEALKRDEQTGDYVYPAGAYGVLLLYTGMRVGELLALRWKDYDWKNGFLTISKSRSMARNREDGSNHYVLIEGATKNDKARKIKLLPRAKDILDILRERAEPCKDDDLIVTTSTGKPNTATNLAHRMKVIFRNCGFSEQTGSLHIFRRTFATRLYEQGVRTKEIAAYLGDLESTVSKYYISARKKVQNGGQMEEVIILPETTDLL